MGKGGFYLFSPSSIWAVKLHWLDNILLYTVTWFMLSDGKKRQQYMHGLHGGLYQIQLDWCLFLFFLDNLAVVLRRLTLQDKHNVRSFALATKQDRKSHQKLTLQPVSKVRTNIFYIFRQWTKVFGRFHFSLYISY
jgi:hypothetical protein